MAHQEETAGGRQLASRLTYPNPFAPSGIDFDLPQDATVSLTILDDSGREVATLLNKERHGAGTHHVDIASSQWAKDLTGPVQPYYYRLAAEYGGKIHIDTKKLVLTKP